MRPEPFSASKSGCDVRIWSNRFVGDLNRRHITATAAYVYDTQIAYMMARDGKVIADDDAKVSFETDRVAIDGKTGKPAADVTRYTCRDGDTRYDVSFERQTTIQQAILTDRAAEGALA